MIKTIKSIIRADQHRFVQLYQYQVLTIPAVLMCILWLFWHVNHKLLTVLAYYQEKLWHLWHITGEVMTSLAYYKGKLWPFWHIERTQTAILFWNWLSDFHFGQNLALKRSYDQKCSHSYANFVRVYAVSVTSVCHFSHEIMLISYEIPAGLVMK